MCFTLQIRYKVEFKVKDSTEIVMFALFDQSMEQLLDILVSCLLFLNRSDKVMLPVQLFSMAAQKDVFTNKVDNLQF